MALQVVASATATFDGTQLTVDVTWPAIVGSFKLEHGVTATDGGIVSADIIARSATGCTVRSSGYFTGTVEVLCFQ